MINQPPLDGTSMPSEFDSMAHEMMLMGYSATPVQPEPPKVDFLELARDAELSSTSWFDSNVRKSMQSSLNQFNAKHDPENSQYSHPFFKGRSKLFMPKTRSNIRKHEATCAQAYFSTQDVVQISAFNDSDPTEQAAADFYKEMLNLRLTSSGPRSIPWFQTVLAAYQDTMVYGIAAAFVDWNHAKNRPEVTVLEPENFRFDPACDWLNPIESSPYLIRKVPMRVGEIKTKIRRGEFLAVSDEDLAKARRPETNSISQARNAGRTDPMQRGNSVREFDIVWVNLNIIQYDGEDYVFYTLGSGDHFLTKPKPIVEVFTHGRRPFVLGTCIIEAHKNYPTSIPMLTKDMQQYQNSIVNQRMDNSRLAMDKRYLVRASARVDKESITRNSPGSVTLVSDVEKDIKVISTPDVNPSAYKEQSLLDIAMDDLVGGFNSGTMQSNRSLNETVGGMTLISQSANQVAEYQLKTFNETFVEPVLRLLLVVEQHYETDKQLIAMAGSNAKLIEKYGNVSYGDIQMKDLMLTVQVGMGATNPATRTEKLMMAVKGFGEAAQIAGQTGLNMKEIGKEIFAAVGYHTSNRFLDPDVDPQVQQLQQQVQQLQQELANKRNPDIDKAQADLLNAQAFKTRSEASFGNVQTAQVLAQMPSIAPIADKVSETNGFVDKNGQNPNYEQGLPNSGMQTALSSLAQQDPDAFVAAHQQAIAHKIRGSTDPLQPSTGMGTFDAGIRGGQPAE